MSQATDYLENKILDDLIVAATTTVHLYTTDPTDADSGTELADDNYSDDGYTIEFGAAVAGVISNSGAVEFPSFAAAHEVAGTGALTHWGIQDDADNLLVYGELTGSPVETGVADVVKIPIGDLAITAS